jgi:hypothetical protein
MAQDHNDIYSIVERLRVLEEGLDKNQRSVNQLSATFRPKTVAVLTAKTDPKNPMAGKLVGGCEESEEMDEDVGMDWDGVSPSTKEFASEDVLERVKRSFTDFVKSVEEEIKDSDIKEKKQEDTDLKKKEKKDCDLIDKNLAEHGTNLPESDPVKTITNESGTWAIHEAAGSFEIQHGNGRLPTRFKNIDEAALAVEMFNLRRKRNDAAQDYIDEA